MFCKYTREEFPLATYIILPTSTIPKNISILDHCMFQLLQQIICLIKEKYDLPSDSNQECIQARFNNSSNYKNATILLLNNFYSENIQCVEQQNKWPIELLKLHNGVVLKERHPISDNRCYSVITLHTADLVKIKECLERLPELELIDDSMHKIAF
jgi:hypothetical protein